VPRHWDVLAAVGFAGALEPFNALWRLGIRDDGGLLGWDNGSDGRDTPRVELACSDAGTWQLTFQFCEFTVRYEKSAADWQPLNAKVLTGPTLATPAREKPPPYVTVIPV
jgi:hypothetical protein